MSIVKFVVIVSVNLAVLGYVAGMSAAQALGGVRAVLDRCVRAFT
jgi:hypothetical protein